MRIAVCIKQVIDCSVPLEIDVRADMVKWEDASYYALNPADRRSIEFATQLKKKLGEATITAVSFGPTRVEAALRECLALGADLAVRIEDAGTGQQPDSLGTALILSRAIGTMAPDLVLCGVISGDSATGSVGPALAEILGLPHVSAVLDCEVAENGQGLVARRQLGKGSWELVECPLPVLLALSSPQGPSPYSSLPKLMRAKRSSIRVIGAEDLGLSEEDRSALSKTVLISLSPPRPRPKKMFVPDSNLPPAERLKQLLAGGATQRKTDLLEGKPEVVASNAVAFMRQQGLLSE